MKLSCSCRNIRTNIFALIHVNKTPDMFYILLKGLLLISTCWLDVKVKPSRSQLRSRWTAEHSGESGGKGSCVFCNSCLSVHQQDFIVIKIRGVEWADHEVIKCWLGSAPTWWNTLFCSHIVLDRSSLHPSALLFLLLSLQQISFFTSHWLKAVIPLLFFFFFTLFCLFCSVLQTREKNLNFPTTGKRTRTSKYSGGSCIPTPKGLILFVFPMGLIIHVSCCKKKVLNIYKSVWDVELPGLWSCLDVCRHGKKKKTLRNSPLKQLTWLY